MVAGRRYHTFVLAWVRAVDASAVDVPAALVY